MIKRFVPTYHANNLFEINPEFFLITNSKVLLLDLDNTLDSYRSNLPSERTSKYIKRLTSNSIRPIITSNNTNRRVKEYASALNIEYISSAGKPFKHSLLKKLSNMNIDKSDCMIVGDQIMTDVACGNACKIKTLLLEKLVPEDMLITKFNRLFDKCIRTYLRKHDMLKNWKEAMGETL